MFKILIALTAVAACSQNTHYAPVHDSAQPPSQRLEHHVVARGETLYSIAWRYNLDYRKLAEANALPSDFRIYPGQRLALRESVTAPPTLNSTPPQTPAKVIKDSPIVTAPPVTRSKKETPPPVLKSDERPGTDPQSWVWPANGALIAGFQENGGLNKGIDIRGNMEEPVVAAASGSVVYAGEGLRGYGKLIIVKHSEKYLSAYAHNHRLLVEEGDTVKQGQKIAAMGSSGTDSVKLHFEIRYDGQPVNPLKYLPKR